MAGVLNQHVKLQRKEAVRMPSILILLIIVILSVIPTLYGYAMNDSTFYLKDSLIHRAINVIYSLLVVGYTYFTYRSRAVKFVAIATSTITILYFMLFVFTLIEEFPKQDLKRELVYHDE